MANLDNAMTSPPQGWTVMEDRPPTISGSGPTPAEFGYSPTPASRGAIHVPALSTVDNLRQFYRPSLSLRRWWPKQ